MAVLSNIRLIFLALGLFGYAFNGAHAHVHVPGDTVMHVGMCSQTGTKAVSLTLPRGPIEETPETCCGDCSTLSVVTLPVCQLLAVVFPTGIKQSGSEHAAPRPRSPLWPGAPPHGPPTHLTV